MRLRPLDHWHQTRAVLATKVSRSIPEIMVKSLESSYVPDVFWLCRITGGSQAQLLGAGFWVLSVVSTYHS